MVEVPSNYQAGYVLLLDPTLLQVNVLVGTCFCVSRVTLSGAS